jgi:hypothetical protein
VSKKYSTFCFDNQNNIIIGQDSDIFDDNNTADIDFSFMINTNNLKENLNKFANNYVLLNNQIMKLLETETNINFENLQSSVLASSQNEEDFKQKLANSGVVKYSELGDLLLEQGQYAIEFQADNKDFAVLHSATKEVLINNAIDAAITANPIQLSGTPEYPQSTSKISCYQQYIIERGRCNRNNNVAAIGVAVSFLGGPWTVGAACLTAMWISKNCFADAAEDYHNCQ